MSFVDFRTSVLRRCEMDDLDRPTSTSLDALHLLLKRHCQQYILRCMMEPLMKYYEEGVGLAFIGDVAKRFSFLFFLMISMGFVWFLLWILLDFILVWH